MAAVFFAQSGYRAVTGVFIGAAAAIQSGYGLESALNAMVFGL